MISNDLMLGQYRPISDNTEVFEFDSNNANLLLIGNKNEIRFFSPNSFKNDKSFVTLFRKSSNFSYNSGYDKRLKHPLRCREAMAKTPDLETVLSITLVMFGHFFTTDTNLCSSDCLSS